MPILNPLSDQDGSWAALKQNWRAQCQKHEEDFDWYAVGAFSVLDPLAAEGHPRAGIYGLPDEDADYAAICQANRTPLPGYDGQVLRVRLMVFAPKYDFGDLEIDDYARVLVGLFSGIVELSQEDMNAKHIKFHLRSPADRQFFAALQQPLTRIPLFETVILHGSWLYVTKSQ
jgi:hypothetical protein